MTQISINDAQENLKTLIDKVIKGEEIVISKNKKPVAKIIKFQNNFGKRKIGTAKGKVIIADDFDEPLEDFKDYS